ncbi:nucleotidyltransferase family protein [Roseicella aerolata]|uniref:glucose-1-phosphate thymidylyltransferase n=1 Tax=Roseicella aerolata TaxID=2883479 RepID=A0A9X1IH85_9PROT|nr:nucleotidyltransferase family protein [Roseicella aerolata]MCB4824146.1 nucleotidyltransferase family protein [Roseicella aerolata]
MWGIIPAAGIGSRIQPLAFSKELLPVGSRLESGVERPRAVSEHLIERMIAGGVDKICFVIAPGKSDIINYYGSRIGGASIAYVVQQEPSGLCDAIFCALPLIAPEEPVVVGLPDTIWFPEAALAPLPDDEFSFLLFPVDRPELFDAVVTDAEGRVEAIEVKRPGAHSRWVWGAFKLPGAVLRDLHALWREPGRGDEYIGTLVNAWLARGGQARGLRGGEVYVDVGTLNGYREAVALLASRPGPRDSAVVPFRVLQQRAALDAAARRPDLAPVAANDQGDLAGMPAGG